MGTARAGTVHAWAAACIDASLCRARASRGGDQRGRLRRTHRRVNGRVRRGRDRRRGDRCRDDRGRDDRGRAADDLEPVDALADARVDAVEIREPDHMRTGRERERHRDRRVNRITARVRDVHGGPCGAVDGHCDLMIGLRRADAEVRGIGAARGDRRRILGPFLVIDVGDVRDAADGSDIDIFVQTAAAARVSCRGVVVGEILAAVVIIFGLNPAGNGMRPVERDLP